MAGLDHVRNEGRTDAGRQLLEQPAGLSGIEGWALAALRRWGTIGLIWRVTLGALIASVVITSLLMLIVFGSEPDVFMRGVILAAVVPTLIAPPIMVVIGRLAARLDDASQRLVTAAITDPLTGVYNRRGFFDGFDPTAVADAPLSVAMIDVDDFKQLNDRFGHGEGDAVLCHIATWLVAHTENRGAVARLGGDEFVMVAPTEVVVRLKPRETFTAATASAITYSATIGAVPLADRSFRQALAAADAELYRHKAARRRGAEQ